LQFLVLMKLWHNLFFGSSILVHDQFVFLPLRWLDTIRERTQLYILQHNTLASSTLIKLIVEISQFSKKCFLEKTKFCEGKFLSMKILFFKNIWNLEI
jgi:hypothetical protein